MRIFGISLMMLGLLAACASQKKQTGLIQDCPEEKIVNKMPMMQGNNQQGTATTYYIYKGERRELAEFDAQWLKEHCTITETVVY